MDTRGTEPAETATSVGKGDAAELAGAASPETAGGWVRDRLVAGWRFARHLLAMAVAMITGMAVLGAAVGVFGEPPGYSNLFLEYGLMGASMSAAMVAWMRYRGHSWSDGGEMTLAMLVPMFALVFPAGLGVAELNAHSLMMLTHVAMIAGMVALMIYRRDRYAHETHDRRT